MLRNLDKPIALGSSKADCIESSLVLSGKLGKVSLPIPNSVSCHLIGDGLVVKSELVSGKMAMVGTFIALAKQALLGVSQGHTRIVNFTGTGASVKVGQGQLEMKLGKSHTVFKTIPEDIKCTIESSDIRQTKLKVFGISDQKVGQFASELRIKRVYKGGIHAWIEGDKVFIKKRKGAK